MFKKKVSLILTGICTVLWIAGCAAPDSALVYSGDQTRKAQTVQLGTVISVKPVKVEGKDNELLTIGGAVLGGLAGSNIGQGKGAVAGAVVGALAGGAGTSAAQRALSSKNSTEVTVKLDSGSMVSIVQASDVALAPGQRVRVMRGQGADRVVPYTP